MVWRKLSGGEGVDRSAVWGERLVFERGWSGMVSTERETLEQRPEGVRE